MPNRGATTLPCGCSILETYTTTPTLKNTIVSDETEGAVDVAHGASHVPHPGARHELILLEIAHNPHEARNRPRLRLCGNHEGAKKRPKTRAPCRKSVYALDMSLTCGGAPDD